MEYKIGFTQPVLVAICCILSYISGILAVHKSFWAVPASMATIVVMAVLLVSIKLTHIGLTRSRGRAVPLFDFVRDGEEILIRGACPHLIDVGRSNIHMLAEHEAKQMHYFADAKVFENNPIGGEAYYKRVGDRMKFIRHFS